MKKTQEKLKVLLQKAKEDEQYMLKVIDKFKPLIISYSKNARGNFEMKDIESILTIRLIEVVRRMNISDYDGENFNYIATALRFEFLNTIKKMNQINNKELLQFEHTKEIGIHDTTNISFYSLISVLDKRKQTIIKLKFEKMLTDAEIGTNLGVSRQAINKQLRKAYTILAPLVK